MRTKNPVIDSSLDTEQRRRSHQGIAESCARLAARPLAHRRCCATVRLGPCSQSRNLPICNGGSSELPLPSRNFHHMCKCTDRLRVLIYHTDDAGLRVSISRKPSRRSDCARKIGKSGLPTDRSACLPMQLLFYRRELSSQAIPRPHSFCSFSWSLYDPRTLPGIWMAAAVPAAVIVAAFRADLEDNYATTAALALASYEFIALYKHEYEFLWRRKWTSATWLFLINRYVMLGSSIQKVAPYGPRVPEYTTAKFLLRSGLSLSCHYRCRYVRSLSSDEITRIHTTVQVFSSMRVFALLQRAYSVALVVLLLGLVPLVTNSYHASHITYYFVNDPVLGASCYTDDSINPNVDFATINFSLSLLTRLCSIASNAVVLVVTWIKTYSHIREASNLGVRVGISATLLRDGSIYFIALLLLSLAVLLGENVEALRFLDYMSTIIDVMQPILISRFIVNLRKVNSPPADQSMATMRFSRFTMPNFHVPTMDNVVGNLGEPLEHGSGEASAEQDGEWESEEDSSTAETKSERSLQAEKTLMRDYNSAAMGDDHAPLQNIFQA
ncbi:hypothetical protein NM688_g3566 [Phlebia brevispora]|uniref:Uncharacterized protein n=1 Tax=Phlebia brevispora TaxID=194682 RepID=A0ACC1T5K6_9APHY|nr:hypothetical protein NM688_g3566 [Phlebia brevispora]